MIPEKKVKSIMILKSTRNLEVGIFYFEIYVQHCNKEELASRCQLPFVGIVSPYGNVVITRLLQMRKFSVLLRVTQLPFLPVEVYLRVWDITAKRKLNSLSVLLRTKTSMSWNTGFYALSLSIAVLMGWNWFWLYDLVLINPVIPVLFNQELQVQFFELYYLSTS